MLNARHRVVNKQHNFLLLWYQRIDNVPVLFSWGLAVLVTKLADKEHALNQVFMLSLVNDPDQLYHRPSSLDYSWLEGHQAGYYNQEAIAYENGAGL